MIFSNSKLQRNATFNLNYKAILFAHGDISSRYPEMIGTVYREIKPTEYHFFKGLSELTDGTSL